MPRNKRIPPAKPGYVAGSQLEIRRMARLSELSMAFSAGLELDALLRKIAVSVREALHAHEAYVLLMDSDANELVLAAAAGQARKRPNSIRCPERRSVLTSPGEFGFAPYRHQSGDEETAQPAGEALLCLNAFLGRERVWYSPSVRDLPVDPDLPFRHAILQPLQTSTQTLGVLVVTKIHEPDRFSENDIEEALVFANLGAMAIEHFKLVRERETRIREMEKLNTLSKRFSTVQTLEGLIGLSFEYLAHIIPHDLGVVSIFTHEEETRYFVAERPLSPKNLDNLTEHIQEITESIRGKASRVIRSQQIFLPNKKGPPMGRVFLKKIQSFITVPLTVQGQNIGLINLSSSTRHAFHRDHLRAFTTLSSLLATAIENVKIRLYLERRYDELSVLFEISQSLTSTLNLDEVLDSIVNFSMEMMNALRCELRLLDPTGKYLEIRASKGLSKSFLSMSPILVGEGIIGSVVSHRKPISVVDIRKDPRTRHLHLVKREKLAGLLAVPLSQRNKPIGVITIYTSKPKDFTQNEIDLLCTFASQASVAIENARLYAQMKEQYLSMVMALAAAIETKDSYTHGHSKKVMDYAVKIARCLDLDEEEVDRIKYAGLLHDIGKIGIKDVILSKPGTLSTDERDELRNHPKYGAFIMEQVDFLKDIAPLTLYHHEKYDGTGYPLGLKGDAIPLGARILAVADTYDSMIADRPYRKAFPLDAVVREIKKVAGTQLDPQIVDVFLRILKDEQRKDV